MTNYQRTANWLKACGKTQVPLHLSVQVGCHMEETAEFLEHLVLLSRDGLRYDHVMNEILGRIVDDLNWLGEHIKLNNTLATISDEDAEGALDALCDMEVTANGVAYCAGWDKDGADQAVLASNDAKLVDGKPVLKEGGKIGKPEGWKAPDLTPFL